MSAFHKRALTLAGNHFVVSVIVGTVCFLYFYGAGLSDTYHEDPVWIKFLVIALWILQFPTALIATVGSPKHHFNVAVLLAVGAVWSMLFSYACFWGIGRFKNGHEDELNGSN